jgi:hypothetical protein
MLLWQQHQGVFRGEVVLDEDDDELLPDKQVSMCPWGFWIGLNASNCTLLGITSALAHSLLPLLVLLVVVLLCLQVKRPAERKRLKRRGDEGREGGREKASGAKQLQEALFGTGGEWLLVQCSATAAAATLIAAAAGCSAQVMSGC